MRTSVLVTLVVIASLTGCAQMTEAQWQRRVQEAASHDSGRFVYGGYFVKVKQAESTRQRDASE
jgi:hypothetical protein